MVASIASVSSKRFSTNTQNSRHTRIGSILSKKYQQSYRRLRLFFLFIFFLPLAPSFARADLTRSHFAVETLATRVDVCAAF